jgi:hypothetical protein
LPLPSLFRFLSLGTRWISVLQVLMKKVYSFVQVVLQERDFYFQKIVEIEKNCLSEEFKNGALSKIICKIMYDEAEEQKA